jgi:hypothetical protein
MSFFGKIKYYSTRPLSLFGDLERWVAYRTYEQYHVVKTDLPPGYYNPSDVLLHAAFKVLKDFVEEDCAYQAEYSHKNLVPRWRKLEEKFPTLLSRIIFPKFRSKELGLLNIEDHIKWTREDPHWSQLMKDAHIRNWEELKTLYQWWINRDSRPEPSDAVGLHIFCDRMRSQYGETHSFKPTQGGNFYQMVFNGTPDEEQEYSNITKAMDVEEKRQTQEDEDMLIRLAKLREFLWS